MTEEGSDSEASKERSADRTLAGGEANREWSLADEERPWQCVTERWRCQKLAQKRNQELIDIKPTGDKVLRWACIFKDKDEKK